MNPVLFMMYNQTQEQLDLSKESLASILAQDVPVTVYAIDNGSKQDTWDWLAKESEIHSNLHIYRNDKNESPVLVANNWFAKLFGKWNDEYVLCVPNDVRLPPNLYSEFMKCPRGVVTGSMTDDRSVDIYASIEVKAVSENTPLCVVMWRSWVWRAITDKDGYFLNPLYFNYCSDCDLALRMAACGIRGVQLNIPYFHFGSASHVLAPEDEAAKMRHGAEEDRRKFYDYWGFKVFDPEYTASALDINFRGEGKRG